MTAARELPLTQGFTRDDLAAALAYHREHGRLNSLWHHRPEYPGTGPLWVFPLAVERLLELVDAGEVEL